MDDATRAVAVFRLVQLFQGAIAQAGGLPSYVMSDLLKACALAVDAAELRANPEGGATIAVSDEATALVRKWMGLEA